ncbi:MAG: peptide-methionine (S)-S-oxide reductase, partial [Clostridia bacterium]|nr:peptide-methionine (S)-S-oxide reductase [Clostridia bacterium]
VYYDDESLLPAIRASFAKTEAELGAKPATELLPLENFFPAEEYHQKYLEKNPGGYCHLPAVLFEKAKSSLPFSREKE